MTSLSEFDFTFDERLIGTKPAEPPRSARMLVFERSTGYMQHERFEALPNYLKEGDCLVVNESYVLPARFKGRKTTGGAIEGLFLSADRDEVRVWLKGRLHEGENIMIDGFGSVNVKTRDEVRATLSCDASAFIRFLKKEGLPPLPPYILKEREASGLQVESHLDSRDYQSIFATESARYSVAAPTASLHFDETLLRSLEARGISLHRLRLHVNEGTFEPIRTSSVEDHVMHSEWAEISASTWSDLNRVKQEGRRVVAVGTTVVRALESAYLRHMSGQDISLFSTDLFIRPPYVFGMIDALVTNFHWPRSSLLLMVAAFMGDRNSWRHVYDEALREEYRLFSFGDGMLIQ